MDLTTDDVRGWLDAACVVLSAPLAQRLYVILLGLGAIVASLAAAIWADRRAAALIGEAEAAFKKRFRGPRPVLADSIRKRIDYIRSHAPGIYRAAGVALGVSFFAGVLVPCAVLLGVTLNYSWFDAGGQHLLDAARQPISTVSVPDAVVFVLDQSARGGLFDLLEIFAIQVAHLDNNPQNLWFSIGLFAHHLFIEAFIFSGLWFFGRVVWRVRRLERDAVDELMTPRSASVMSASGPGLETIEPQPAAH